MGIKTTMTSPPELPQVLHGQDQAAPSHPEKSRKFSDFLSTLLSTAGRDNGYSFVEVVVVLAILATLSMLGMPAYYKVQNTAKAARAEAEVRELEKLVTAYALDNNTLPNSFDDIGRANFKDPWGNAYEYSNVAGGGASRKDFYGVEPLNRDFDIFSKGPDGVFAESVADADSRDDIVRGGEGGFVGLVSSYY